MNTSKTFKQILIASPLLGLTELAIAHSDHSLPSFHVHGEASIASIAIPVAIAALAVFALFRKRQTLKIRSRKDD